MGDDEGDSESESDDNDHLFECGSVWPRSVTSKRALDDDDDDDDERQKNKRQRCHDADTLAGATTSDDADDTCRSSDDEEAVVVDNVDKTPLAQKTQRNDEQDGRQRQSSVPPLLQSTCGSFGADELGADDERVVEKFLMTLSQQRAFNN